MMKETRLRVDAVRSRSSELENDLIDAYRGGTISRRDFVRRGTVIGVSLPLLGFLASACGSGEKGGEQTDRSQQPKVKKGGTIRSGIAAPTGALDPLTLNNYGGIAILGQSGEYLTWADTKLRLQPRLAESWNPNRDGSVWTFKLRRGIRFQDGRPLAAADVVATIDRLADPDGGSNSLSAFRGVLSKGNATAVDDATVEFQLDAPNGNFPYLVSSDNYNAIILPRDFDGDWEKTFIGTGPWKLEKFTPDIGVTFVKNPDYWDTTRQPNADRSELRFYSKEQAAVLAMQGGEVDVVAQFSASGGRALLTDPNVRTIALRSATHDEVHTRTDIEPFRDKRVRQALALLVDRRALVDGLFAEKADPGNDSPFAPGYASTDASVAQRQQDVEKAKQLLADAGKADGFSVKLSTLDELYVPDHAQLLQNDAKQAGIEITLEISDKASYYGDSVFGESRWLDSTLGITNYAHRAVPNVLLGAPLKSDGTWNAAHFHNEDYDKLVDDYAAALDVESQRTTANKIQTLLLDEVPVQYPFFASYLTAVKKTVAGVEPTATGHLDLRGAGSTA
ncbi:MAG TPA: ABC transporter substrate-binding protein [Solirubrobacteraceae bacterium]|nr:ABC transporter substrate-binding protein [Solirubrobacteraceae bacterium]